MYATSSPTLQTLLAHLLMYVFLFVPESLDQDVQAIGSYDTTAHLSSDDKNKCIKKY